MTVGAALCLNFSRDGQQRILELTKLPKRFHERPRKQDVYSKLDWERHPSHAPPYGFGTPMPSTDTDHAMPDDSDPPRRKRRGGSARKRKETGAFIAVPALLPAPRIDCARCPVLAPTPPLRASPFRLVPAQREMGARTCVPAKATGGKGFGDAKKKQESGFSKAKQDDPEKFPQMQAVFTCNKCETRQSKIFSRLAYEEGVVVVKCTGCGVQHIMADNLGYFQDSTGKKAVNVEDLLRAKGEQVDNRLSEKGITGLKLAAPTEGPDGTLEVRPQNP